MKEEKQKKLEELGRELKKVEQRFKQKKERKSLDGFTDELLKKWNELHNSIKGFFIFFLTCTMAIFVFSTEFSNLITGILIIANIVLTIIAAIRGWKWWAISILPGSLLICVIIGGVLGGILGPFLMNDLTTGILLSTLVSFLVLCFSTIVLIFMMKNLPTEENKRYLLSFLKGKKDIAKSFFYFLGLTFLFYIVLCFLSGFFGATGRITGFAMIISIIASMAIIFSISKKKKEVISS